MDAAHTRNVHNLSLSHLFLDTIMETCFVTLVDDNKWFYRRAACFCHVQNFHGHTVLACLYLLGFAGNCTGIEYSNLAEI